MASISRALVPVPRDTCPACGHAPVDTERYEMAALVRHAGYGATEATTIRSCPVAGCPWWLIVAVADACPDRQPAVA